MINGILYKREMKSSIKLLFIFAAVITMYVSIIISMYDPKLMQTLDSFIEVMPEIMAAVGMSAGATTLLGFMISYLYGFILLIFPMIYCIIRGNGLIAKYVDKGSMYSLVAAPVRRRTIVLTQMAVLNSGVLFLLAYATILELAVAKIKFPNELDTVILLKVNLALLCLHLFVASVCFIASCFFPDTKYSVGFGAGIPALMYIVNMLANVGGKAENAKYFTFFTLFDAQGIVNGTLSATIGAVVLLCGAVILFVLSVIIFERKDLHI